MQNDVLDTGYREDVMRFAVVIFLCVPLLAGCGKDASHTATPGAKLNVPMV